MINLEKKILIVDDSPMELQALSSILSPHYEVLVSKDKLTALEIATTQDIDLILLDTVLNNVESYTTLQEFKRHPKTKSVPVILITSKDFTEDDIPGLYMGAVDYIKRPFLELIVKLRVGIQLQLVSQARLIENFALVDDLTQLNNFRSFKQALSSEWTRSIRNKLSLSLILLDIDNFRKFNDEHGFLNGDAVLKNIASSLDASTKRGSDNAFRVKGGTFGLILPETPKRGAGIVAERIRLNISTTPLIVDKKPLYVTVSMGFSTALPKESNYNDIDEFYQQASKALMVAKENGKNKVEFL